MYTSSTHQPHPCAINDERSRLSSHPPNVPGYWAEEVVSLLKSGAGQPGFTRPKMCIVSGYPDGLAPYERSEISKECLRPANQHSRDWQVGGCGFEFARTRVPSPLALTLLPRSPHTVPHQLVSPFFVGCPSRFMCVARLLLFPLHPSPPSSALSAHTFRLKTARIILQAWGNKVFPFTSTGNDRERRCVVRRMCACRPRGVMPCFCGLR